MFCLLWQLYFLFRTVQILSTIDLLSGLPHRRHVRSGHGPYHRHVLETDLDSPCVGDDDIAGMTSVDVGLEKTYALTLGGPCF